MSYMVDNKGWTAGPPVRGSFDILWTCLATLALCAWTAVHPNILPVPSASRTMIQRLGMMIVAILFPEFIISAAWRQWRVSRWLCYEVNRLKVDANDDVEQSLTGEPKVESQLTEYTTHTHIHTDSSQRMLLPTFDFESQSAVTSDHNRHSSGSIAEQDQGRSQTSSESPKKPHNINWTIEQGFFVTMGGLAVESTYRDERNQEVTMRRLLTVEGIACLAIVGLLPSVNHDDIEDRSKADMIAKMFVLFQVMWFGLQVVGRLASDLPVTPLEGHTAVHVGCAIVMYLVWLKKPYNLTRSILLEGDAVADMAALFNFYEIACTTYTHKETAYASEREAYWKSRLVRASNNIVDHDPPPTAPVREPLTVLLDRYSSEETATTPAKDNDEYALQSLAPSGLRALDRLRLHGQYTSESINAQSWNFLRNNSENFAIRGVWGGWSTNTGHEMSSDKAIQSLFIVLYGAGHLAAWGSSSFPTTTERWLWRGSAIMLCAAPLWGFLWVIWWHAVGSNRKALHLISSGGLDFIAAPFFATLLLAYTLARCYFLVESLASLRSLPSNAYDTISWTHFLPHVS